MKLIQKIRSWFRINDTGEGKTRGNIKHNVKGELKAAPPPPPQTRYTGYQPIKNNNKTIDPPKDTRLKT